MKLKTKFIEDFPILELSKYQNNPRFINSGKFEQLVRSVRDFPQMLKIRPIVVNEDNVIIAGNMRFEAAKKLNFESVPVLVCFNLSTKKQREFVIKDNISFGFWDFDELSNSWEENDLLTWGLTIPGFDQIPGFEDSFEDDPFDGKRLKRVLKIKIQDEDFEEAKKIVEIWERRGLNVGAFLIEKLREIEPE